MLLVGPVNGRPDWVGPAGLVWEIAIAGLVLPGALVIMVWLKVTASSSSGGPLRSLAAASAVAGLAPKGASARARQLRPSLAGVKAKNLNLDDVGVALGRLLHNGPVLRATWEDVLLAVMAPRAGKTTALAVPAILSAPGAVIATSNKSDLWAATTSLRADKTGETVWTSDPQHVVHGAQTWWWNPLGAVDNVEEAYRLAGHFVQEIREERLDRDFWSQAVTPRGAAPLCCDYQWGRRRDHRAIRRLGRPVAAVGGVAQRVDERVRCARALCPRGARFGCGSRGTGSPARAPDDRQREHVD
jgi:hypothetical protein